MNGTPTLPSTPVKVEIEPTPPKNARVPGAVRPLGGIFPNERAGAKTAAWKRAGPWLIAFLMCCAWDRAVWLMVSRDGVPILHDLGGAIQPKVLWALFKATMGLDPHAAGELAATIPYLVVYQFGRIYIWIIPALFFIFRHWGGTDGAKVREGLRRGVFVFLTPAIAGLAAEGLKFLTRRARPEVHDGFYTFLPWPDKSVLHPAFWTTTDLGLASSHAAVAFGGALAAGLLLPKWRGPLFLLAALCTLSRVAVGAHFVSDAFAGAAIAFAAYTLVYAWDRRNNGGMGIVPEGEGGEMRIA